MRGLLRDQIAGFGHGAGNVPRVQFSWISQNDRMRRDSSRQQWPQRGVYREDETAIREPDKLANIAIQRGPRRNNYQWHIAKTSEQTARIRGVLIFEICDRVEKVSLAITAALHELDDARRANLNRERGKTGSQKRLGPTAAENEQLSKAIVHELKSLKNPKLSQLAKMTHIRPDDELKPRVFGGLAACRLCQ